MMDQESLKPLWERCLRHLEQEFSGEELNMWVYPLQIRMQGERLALLAPNAFVRQSVADRLLPRIQSIMSELAPQIASVELQVGTLSSSSPSKAAANEPAEQTPVKAEGRSSGLAEVYTFDNYVQGKSNEMARAAAHQVAENPGRAYNPLLLYGSTGLGKTHLLHAAGNFIRQQRKGATVVYLHSEEFVRSMILALRHNTIDEFKRQYRKVDALLIDDIQFFAGKDRSQEEFFHTFNALLEGQQQVVVTCDRYPKEVSGLEERLKSRFGWGLSVPIEPPDFETRVAILMSKAKQYQAMISEEVAFFVAKRIRSNVRELEGALKTLIAHARFAHREVTVDFAKETLRDLLAGHEQAVSIDNIKKVVAGYYNISIADLHSRRRNRAIARPRQMAMTLCRELTDHSLPEIGEAFGGRDHSTVLYATEKIAELCAGDRKLREDKDRLLRSLSN